jgi:hypothetical protein
MLEITETLLLGVAMWFAVATVVMPLVGLLWHFAKLLLKSIQ